MLHRKDSITDDDDGRAATDMVNYIDHSSSALNNHLPAVGQRRTSMGMNEDESKLT